VSDPPRLPIASSPWLPVRFWRRVAYVAVRFAVVTLSVHRNAEFVAAGLLGAGTAIAAYTAARVRASRGQPSDLADVLTGALALATILMSVLSLAPGTQPR
jgi:hypothetical protein